MSEGHPGRSESIGPNKRMVPSHGWNGSQSALHAPSTDTGCLIGPSLTLYEHFCAEAKKKTTTLRYLWWLCGREVHWSARRGDKSVNVPHPAEIFIGKNKEVIVCNRCAWNMIGVLKAFWASIYLETFTLPIKSCHRLRLCSPPAQDEHREVQRCAQTWSLMETHGEDCFCKPVL